MFADNLGNFQLRANAVGANNQNWILKFGHAIRMQTNETIAIVTVNVRRRISSPLDRLDMFQNGSLRLIDHFDGKFVFGGVVAFKWFRQIGENFR